LEREDVANMEKENEKNSYEIRQELRNSSGCYYSYLYRTMVELVKFSYIFFPIKEINIMC
jgi:hypothetical protein